MKKINRYSKYKTDNKCFFVTVSELDLDELEQQKDEAVDALTEWLLEAVDNFDDAQHGIFARSGKQFYWDKISVVENITGKTWEQIRGNK